MRKEDVNQNIYLIACDFWMSEKGKTAEEIKEFIKTDEGLKIFLKPGVDIYKKLKLNFK
jgi:hypothetical protein